MKSRFTIFTFLLFTGLLGIAQVNSAKQYSLFEHFTNSSCAPCAAQNPIFQGDILANNVGNIHHIAHHTWWPGNDDPFYQFNIAENTTRTNFYGVNAVPTMIMRGNQWTGGPAAVTQTLINNDQKYGSPIRVKVSETTAGANHNVSVEIQTLGTAPSGSHVLMVAVIEKDKTYPTPPGTNGETYFPNAFRKYLTSSSGNPITLAATGSSVTSNFTYQMDAAWDYTKMYITAFVQNSSTKEIINSGSSIDPNWEHFNTSAGIFKQSAANVSNTFTSNMEMLTGSENIVVSFIANQPNGWASACTFNGFGITDSLVFTPSPGSSNPISVSVTPSSTAGIGTYTVSVYSLNNPQYSPQTVTFYVMSGVTDLIVTNEMSFGDGSPSSAYNWAPQYEAGLAYAGNTTFASTSHLVFLEAEANNMLQGVNNIYYNVGWSFPGLTDENVAAFKSFMDAGGNLLICGQDIGWETWDQNGYGTTDTRDFYTNYLQAHYYKDGANTNNLLVAQNGDAIFGNVSVSPIDPVYADQTNDYMYPDVIGADANGSAVSIFNYNNNPSKVAGIRADNGTFKVVYLGIGIEMISDTAVRNEFVKLTHNWFNGIASGIEYDQAIKALMINAYPNPTQDILHLNFGTLDEDALLEIHDIAGHLVWSDNCQSGDNTLNISVADWKAGLYVLTLNGNNLRPISKLISIQ